MTFIHIYVHYEHLTMIEMIKYIQYDHAIHSDKRNIDEMKKVVLYININIYLFMESSGMAMGAY